MKSQFQTLSFLSQYSPKSDLDSEMILGFLSKRYKNFPQSRIFAPESTLNPLDAQSFLQWFESGSAATEIAFCDGKVVILGNCTLESATIIGSVSDEGFVIPETRAVHISDLAKADEASCNWFYKALRASRLQFDQSTLTLVEKYIPEPNEKVIFHSQDFSQMGTGVVRSIDTETGDVELYCYYLYPPANTVGFSMHERGIANLIDNIFEPMLEDDKRASKYNGVSCSRRLNNELGKRGKIWKDKIKRIEPAQYELEPGKDYWYISDELKVIQKKEKGTPTSHFRYLAGNYFVTRKSAEEMKRRITELLQLYLATPNWPGNE